MSNGPFKHHILVCTQEKPDGLPACAATGGKALLDAIRGKLGAAGLANDTLVTGCGCLGLCERGPNVVVYPQGRWYTGVQPADIDGIVREELQQDRPLEGRSDPDPLTIQAEVNAHRAKVRTVTEARAKGGVLPDELTALANGFRTSRLLLTAIELNLFTAIGSGASEDEIATKLHADRRGTSALLHALESIGLVQKKNGRFFNGDWARSFLTEGAPHDARSAFMHTVHLWNRWSGLTESVRTGSPAASGPYTGESLTAFIAAMHKNATFRAPMIVGALDLTNVRQVLDVGGGSGAYSIALARAKADLQCTVFDLPPVLPLARRNVAVVGLDKRIRFAPGDLRTDPLGTNFDLALVFAICHMLGPKENLGLLRSVFAALRPGGTIAIQDFVLNDDHTGHPSAALFALNMLVNTSEGGCYSGAEYRAWLAEAGFVDVRQPQLPSPTGLLLASKPA